MRITNRLAGSLLAGLLTLGMAGPALADTPEADGARPSPIAEAAGHRCAPSVGFAMSTIMSEADRLDGGDAT